MDWDDFRYLYAVYRAGSLGAAARALKVDPSTIGRRLSALEESLGAQLVLRAPDGVKLTDEGVSAAMAAEKMHGLVDDLVRGIGGSSSQPRGAVRVSISEGFASVLYTGIAKLRERHAEICVELVMSNEPVDLANGAADVAVRLFRETKGNLVARKVAEMGWAIYAAESYLERRGVPEDPLSLAGREVVGYADAGARSSGAKWIEAHGTGATIVFRGTTGSAVLQAVKAGMGVSVMPCFLAEATPSLRRLSPTNVATSEVFLVYTEDARNVERIRIVVEALAAIFASQKAFLAGQRDASAHQP